MAAGECKCPRPQIAVEANQLGQKMITLQDGTVAPYYDFEDDGTGAPSRANDRDRDGRYGLDCSHLVWIAVKAAGFKRIPYFSTNNFNDDSLRQVLPGRWERPSKYYCEVSLEDAKPGDIIIFGGHSGIIETVSFDWGDLRYEGTVINCSRRIWRHDGYDGIGTADWADGSLFGGVEYARDGGVLYGTDGMRITKVLRPKCGKKPPRPPWPHQPAGQGIRRVDPLILDLDGAGIETFGLSSNVRFDYDSNGFMEVTGKRSP